MSSLGQLSSHKRGLSSQTVQSKAREYEDFIESSARNHFHLRPLHNFISWASKIKAKIWLVTFDKDVEPKATLLHEHSTDPQQDLATWLEKDSAQQLYIVEDISPETMKLLGGYLDIDPHFFADYLHMVLPDKFSNPPTIKRSKGDHRCVEPVPFFRWGDIGYHLTPLQSVENKKTHSFVQYIGPREYRATENQSKIAVLEDRLHVDSSCTNVERIAGAHNPVQLDDRRVWPVAMTRHSVAAWFSDSVPKAPGGWLKGVCSGLHSNITNK